MEPTEVHVDARGLEPPEPLVRIMTALDALPAGARLHAQTDRRPIHLYALLESRGFLSETREDPGHGFHTVICRAP